MTEKRGRIKTGDREKDLFLFSGSVLLLFAVLLLSVSAGSASVSPWDTARIFINRLFNTGELSGIPDTSLVIILKVRLPRVVLAGLVGSSLALAGGAMQGLLKNPLADGSTLGITSGGALGAVLSLVIGLRPFFLPELGPVLLSILFSFMSLLLILGLARRLDKGLSTNTIILTGVIFSMFAGSITSFLIAFSGEDLKQVVFWTMGSLSGRGWNHAVLLLPFWAFGSVIILLFSRELNAFSMGEEQARYIGVNTAKVKLLLLITVSVLTGVSVAVSGTIGFVGLVVPHVSRMLGGPDHKRLLPLSMILGAVFLMGADLVSRVLLSPVELPIGIVTSFTGSLFFAWLFYRKRAR